MSRAYDFDERLAFSLGQRKESDVATIMHLLKGCVSVEETAKGSPEQLRGIDFFATLRRGRRVAIDSKARERGCSRHWRCGPEVALEHWSVCPGGKYAVPLARAVAGWTLSEAYACEYVLFTFAPADCPGGNSAYLVPFQLLRVAYRINLHDWHARFRTATQDSGSWESECVFVPVAVIWEAVRAVSRCQAVTPVPAAAPDLFDAAAERARLADYARRWREFDGGGGAGPDPEPPGD